MLKISWHTLFRQIICLTVNAGLMVAGSVIMVNLIVAIIITDVKNLVDTSREQALVNEVYKLSE